MFWNNLKIWNIVNKHKHKDYIEKDNAGIQRFFLPVLYKFPKHYTFVEIGSASSFNLQYLLFMGYLNLIGIEYSFNRIVHSFLAFRNPIPVMHGTFKTVNHAKDIDVMFTFSALFLNKKKIVKDIAYCRPKYFGCSESLKHMRFNIEKEFKKVGYELIFRQNDGRFTIMWFKRNDIK